jgi:hypothetical protein
MKTLIAATLSAITAAALAAPAQSQAPAKKTRLVSLEGESVPHLSLLYDFDAVWVIDTQRILYRDVRRDYYLVTLKEACTPIASRARSFEFFPGWTTRLVASSSYEVRPEAGQPCAVAGVARISDANAAPLRDASLRRVW